MEQSRLVTARPALATTAAPRPFALIASLASNAHEPVLEPLRRDTTGGLTPEAGRSQLYPLPPFPVLRWSVVRPGFRLRPREGALRAATSPLRPFACTPPWC